MAKPENQSSVSIFLVVGLCDSEEPQPLLFFIFLGIYLTTVVGNIIILSVVSFDQRLHSPMYFFLANLSIIDIIFSTINVPKLLFILVTGQKAVSFSQCVTQVSFFQFLLVVESWLIAIMAYDRYVAICFPLNYTLIMSREVRFKMVSFCWAIGLVNLVMQSISISSLDFCGPNRVDHFFCDVTPLFTLSCSDTQLAEGLFMFMVALCGAGPLTYILVTYGRIIAAVTKISTSKGPRKAFTTCTSHVTVVVLFYGSGILAYVWPVFTTTMDKEVKVVAVLYTIMTPMLNPIIYSLRNREVKQALIKMVGSMGVN